MDIRAPVREIAAPLVEGPRLAPGERRRALRISTWEGIAAQCHASLTGLGLGGNAFTYAFAILLGASDLSLGLVAAIPQVAMVSQIGSAYLARRIRHRKPVVAGFATFGRLVFLVAPLLALLVSPEASLAAFVGLWALGNVCLNVAGNGWTSWMSDLVPRPIRGRYISRRTAAAGLAGMAVFLAAGYALDACAGAPPGASPEADARRLAGFAGVFLAAGAAGVASAWLLVRQPEPPPDRSRHLEGVSGVALLRVPFADLRFRRLLLFFAVFCAVNGLANPFWTPYVLEDLGADYSFLTVLGVAAGLGGLATLTLWGRVADRYGSRPILVLVVLVTAFHPLCYLVASREFLAPLYLDAISSGVMWGGYNLAVFNLLLLLAPRQGREVFYAVFAAIAGIAMGASSFASGMLVEHLRAVEAAGRVWSPREIVFVATICLRLGCLPLVLGIEEPRSRGVRAVAAGILQMFRGRLGPIGPIAAPARGREP